MYRIKMMKNEYGAKKTFGATNPRIQTLPRETKQQTIEPDEARTKCLSKKYATTDFRGKSKHTDHKLQEANGKDKEPKQIYEDGRRESKAEVVKQAHAEIPAVDDENKKSRNEKSGECSLSVDVETETVPKDQKDIESDSTAKADRLIVEDSNSNRVLVETEGAAAVSVPDGAKTVIDEKCVSEDYAPEDGQQEELLYKHPLQNVWTLWYLENDRTKSWEEMQNEITSFDTVEDFWSLYNHIKLASEIKVGSDYSLFKKGVRPMWEDVANRQGGRWVITINKACREELDNLWLDTLLCLIGEAFDNSEHICGAVLNIRGKSNKISVWTKDGYNESAVLEIGCKLRDILHLPRQNLQYQLHKDTMVKQGSNIKSLYAL